MPEDQDRDFFKRVQEGYDGMSASLRKIADHVTARFDEVVFSSAAELASVLGTSEATVVRFAQALGYKGFPDLKRELIRHYRDRVTPARKLERYLDNLSADDNFYARLVEREIEFLRNSTASIDGAAIHEAARKICQARHCYIFTAGANAALAHYLSFRLNRFRLEATAVTDEGKTLFEKFIHLTPEDVVVNFSFYQPTPEHEAIMNFAGKRGIPNILITDTFVPPMVRDAELVLYARRGPFGMFHSLLVPMAITNALITAVAEKLGPEAIAALQELSDIRRDYSHAALASIDNPSDEGPAGTGA